MSEDVAIGIALSGGQEHDAPSFAPLCDQSCLQAQPKAMVLDKGYDSNAIRHHLDEQGIEAVIPSKANRIQQLYYRRSLYRERNRIERLFNKLKNFRAVATRYQKLAKTFLALVLLALSVLILKTIR